MTDAIQLDNISFSYGSQRVLDDVSLSVRHREFMGLIGPNGGGKSTLLRLILGLLPPQEGRISVLDTTPRRAARRLGYVPQFARFARSFPISVEDVVLMGRLGQGNMWGFWKRSDRHAITDILDLLEITHLRSRHIEALSGGQMQRVLIARALVANPEILLLDEPTASVDRHGETSLFELFSTLKKNMTVMVISHDLGFISDYVDRVACLNQSLVMHPTAAVTADTINQLYGEQVQMVHHHHAH
ncbi:metal ABC transporter ATP-binding protein [Larsenimonas rhizosphaerae]|uniref:Metal ABC transporter ATP-binding protein n=1 Tax=Larsenimonas rhizosphaerae TaxID=2944682 RepID=A0AA42CTT7_9GAMM|nr:metal ABC transporter ATP-binding protein [Larsenimonas rhizosphaerae]MCM2130697.1 metal ABC transporter ATP-binding protein [Larsenimonas rhizosphaerae]MCX2523401.1 metal ABC transporter ATP-binding protein [Larsenimonas rhizosphaerae]